MLKLIKIPECIELDSKKTGHYIQKMGHLNLGFLQDPQKEIKTRKDRERKKAALSYL